MNCKFIIIQLTLFIYVWEFVMLMENGSLKIGSESLSWKEKPKWKCTMEKVLFSRSMPEMWPAATLKERWISLFIPRRLCLSFQATLLLWKKSWKVTWLNLCWSRTSQSEPRRRIDQQNNIRYLSTLFLSFEIFLFFSIF